MLVRVPKQVLTLGMDVPEAWLVEPVRAEPDLDNLRLTDLGSAESLSVEYELEALLLTGSCVDVSAKRRDQVCLIVAYTAKSGHDVMRHDVKATMFYKRMPVNWDDLIW